ncbi:FAD-dependent oxidoreductase, partial [bacterium]|nr:FAD-dependent oxidoreductase [bacterium]
MEKLIIIGGGSAGLAGAIYASRALLNPILFEGIPGGQLGLTSDVENYPGFENPILGPILMQQFRNQALRFGTRIVSQKIKEVKTSSVIKVMTETDEEYETEALLIATGAEPKWLGLQSEQRLRG